MVVRSEGLSNSFCGFGWILFCRVVLAIIGIPTSLLQNNDEGILDQQGKLQFSVDTVVVQCMHMHCIITVSIAELQLILISWRGIVFLVFLMARASPSPPRVAKKSEMSVTP
jgi:hypothetical protein